MSLGLLSTAAGRTEDDRAKVRGVITAMEEKGIPQVLDTLVDRWFTDAFLEARPDAVQARLKQVIDTPAEVFLNVFRIYAETEMAPWLREVTAPSLVLTGETGRRLQPAPQPLHRRRTAQFGAGDPAEPEALDSDRSAGAGGGEGNKLSAPPDRPN